MSTLLTSWETCNNENHLMPLIYLAVVVALLVSSRASIRFPFEPIRHFAEKWVFVGRVLATHFVHGPTINYSRRVAWAYFLRVVTAPRPGGKRKRKQRGQDSNKMHGMEWNGLSMRQNLMDAINSGLARIPGSIKTQKEHQAIISIP